MPPREQAVDILWRSYLAGLLPLADLNAHEIRLAPERLSRIATPCAQSLPAPPSPEVRVVARLQWAENDLLIIPDSVSAPASVTPGSLLLQQGRLEYVLPARAPTAPDKP
jgi:hypothetical protein